MNEQDAVSVWFRTVLGAAAGVTAITGTRLYESLAPDGTAYPFVVWQYMSGVPSVGAGADRRILVRSRWLLSCYAEGGDNGDFGPASLLASVVDAALQGAASAVTVDGQQYWVAAAQMEQPFRALEATAGSKRIYRVGGYYRIIAHGLP